MIKIYSLFLFIIYLYSINLKLALISTIILCSILIYLKKQKHVVIFLILIYTSSLLYKLKKIEKFENNNDENNENENNENNENNETTSSDVSIIDKNKDLVLTADKYSEIFFVLNSLLGQEYFNKNKKNIDRIIKNYNIENIYDFADKILNIEEDTLYNNFLEKITCIKDSESNNIDYLDCDNENYKKVYAFSELIKVYTLSIEKVLELINKNKIFRLCDLSANRAILQNYDNMTSFGYEYMGLLYYINEINISERYFKILELLELDKLIDNPNNISLREKMYYYNNKDKELLKDLNSIIVLFEYYNVFDKLRMNNEEDDYNWNYGILKQIDLNKLYWDSNYYFLKYKIKDKIINTINKLTKENKKDDLFSIELNNKYKKFIDDDKKIEEDKNNKYLNEYKVIEDLNKKSNKINDVNVLELLSLEYLKNNFAKVFIEIIEDLINIYNRRCALDCPEKNNIFNIISFYIKEIFKIFTYKGRLLYVGLFVIFISIMLYFIEISK